MNTKTPPPPKHKSLGQIAYMTHYGDKTDNNWNVCVYRDDWFAVARAVVREHKRRERERGK